MTCRWGELNIRMSLAVRSGNGYAAKVLHGLLPMPSIDGPPTFLPEVNRLARRGESLNPAGALPL